MRQSVQLLRGARGLGAQARARCLSIKTRDEARDWYKAETKRLESGRRKMRQFEAPVVTTRAGRTLLEEPLLNKGSGFNTAERDAMNLRGLVPPRTLSMGEQARKIMQNVRAEPDPLHQNIYLQSLQDRNEVLYYRVLQDNIAELAPVVYTPTVGEVCQKFGQNFQRTRGMYFSGLDRGHMAQMMFNWPEDDVEVIVVTDGSRILGLGDLGTNGMGIPVGKLALYVAAGGIDPAKVLPVCIDTGTNNTALQDDDFYLGLQHPRLSGEAYYSLVDEFMQAVRFRWPRALVQFEDFSSNHALTLLETYRREYLCFNDDIQGTGATAVAGVLSALRSIGEALTDQRIMIVGAGSAGTGVGVTLLQAMVREAEAKAKAKAGAGAAGAAAPTAPSTDELSARFVMVDEHGLLGAGRQGLDMHQALFQHHDMEDGLSIERTVEQFQPTILLGLSGCAGLFTEAAVRAMAEGTEHPIIFPLSNPTSKSECTAEQAVAWTGGRVIFASGSPFDPVQYDGRTISTSQCNNMFIFPGLGLGAVLARARKVTQSMLQASSLALADSLTAEERAAGQVFPCVERIRDVSARVAAGVMLQAARDGVAHEAARDAPGGGELALRGGERALEDVVDFARSEMWEARYAPLCKPADDFTPGNERRL
eukprot:g1232.t1